jgi:hypothetical protein
MRLISGSFSHSCGFSCTLGALTFSGFEDVYTANGPGESNPDTTADITVSFAEAMGRSDPFGTAATGSSASGVLN